MKTKMIGLTHVFTFNDYLITQDDGYVNYLCKQYRIRSLIHFCQTGKFLDEK